MKKMKQLLRKKRVLVMAFCLALVLSGCGSASGLREGKDSKQGADTTEKNVQESNTASGVQDTADVEDNGDEEVAEGDMEAATEEVDPEETGDTADGKTTSDRQEVSKEMLIYRGNVIIETLHFDQSVKDFKDLLAQVDGFVETESYTDDGEQGGYFLMEEAEKHNSYTATVRIPSSEYDRMMNATGNFGDVRSQSSRAENVTQQYGTYQSELKIYETEYKRYMTLLEKAQEDEYALKIEEKMFDLQVKIADLKSSITNIETDVAYSYLDITIREVSKYQEEPVRTDTFLDRLKNTCAESWMSLLDGLEGLLFFLIRAWYYLVIMAVIGYLIFRCYKKRIPGRRIGVQKETEDSAMEGSVIEDAGMEDLGKDNAGLEDMDTGEKKKTK